MSADMAVIESDVAALEALDPQSREIALTGILTQSRDWLVRATQATDPARAVSDFKAFITTVTEAAKQKKVSEEIVTEATVMVRRTERALGVAIREGQERGTISTVSSGAAVAAHNREARRRGEQESSMRRFLPNANEYVPNGQATVDTYAMADDVTDAQFEEALTEAVEEGNVSRANVVRKIKGEDKPKREPNNPNKTAQTMERVTSSLWGLRHSLQEITAVDPDLDPAQAAAWIKEFSSTSQELNRIKNLLKGKN